MFSRYRKIHHTPYIRPLNKRSGGKFLDSLFQAPHAVPQCDHLADERLDLPFPNLIPVALRIHRRDAGRFDLLRLGHDDIIALPTRDVALHTLLADDQRTQSGGCENRARAFALQIPTHTVDLEIT